MIKNSLNLYQIGKDLGLNKKEIKNLLLFGNSKHKFLYTLLLWIVVIVVFGILLIIGIQSIGEIYPSGSLYSSVKRKDFKRTKRI